MSHHTIREWGELKLGDNGFTRDQAGALHAAACAHPLAHRDATNILVYRHDRIVARQMVGMVAARGCSLEILPKVDPDAPDESAATVRSRLVQMLDVALGLDLDSGNAAAMHRQNSTLLEILIRQFAYKLLAEVRRGLPRLYQPCEEDLPALRGRLDVVRQFTRNAVRPDRLACRYDRLDADTPLMRIMASAVVFLGKHARAADTRRTLGELRHVLVDIPFVPANRLDWKGVRIDRTNRRWASLFRLARLLLDREWQTTHHRERAAEGLTLLFAMNDLFESYIAAMLRRAMAGSDIEVVAQGGLRHCLGPWVADEDCIGTTFQTKPDIILRRGNRVLTIVDTKWKTLAEPFEGKGGVSQGDVYQLMAYARLYRCDDLLLLYPTAPMATADERMVFGMAGGREKLRIAQIDIAADKDTIIRALKEVLASADNYRRNGHAGSELLVSGGI